MEEVKEGIVYFEEVTIALNGFIQPVDVGEIEITPTPYGMAGE